MATLEAMQMQLSLGCLGGFNLLLILPLQVEA